MKEEIIRLLNKLSDRDLRGILYVLQTLTKEEVQHEKAAFKKAETAAWEDFEREMEEIGKDLKSAFAKVN